MDKKTALVTGASRGIGAAIADRLAEEGFFVVGTATSTEAAAAIGERLGDNGMGVVMQLRDRDSIEAAYALIVERGNMPVVLVNNAGITRDNLLMRLSEDDWLDVIDTNVNGLYRVTKPLLRAMLKERWGRIVNLGSVVGRMGNPGQGNYVASKSAAEGFTRSLALEVASRGITVNAVAPGFIATDMTADLTEDQSAAMLDRIPLGRMGQAQDVAGTVAFLVGDDASYITGQTLHVNGGLYSG
jgi:3-oxoacyl-[acyl-carrier protein] reductase